VFEVNEKCEKAVQGIKDRNLKLLSDFAHPQTTGREDSEWLDLPPPAGATFAPGAGGGAPSTVTFFACGCKV